MSKPLGGLSPKQEAAVLKDLAKHPGDISKEALDRIKELSKKGK
jgi:hypothetical protein